MNQSSQSLQARLKQGMDELTTKIAELQKLTADKERTQQELINLKQELTKAQKLNAQFNEEATRATAKILAERASQLEVLEKDSLGRLANLDDDYTSREQAINALLDQCGTQERQLEAINQAIAEKNQLLGEVDEQIARAHEKVTALNATKQPIIDETERLRLQLPEYTAKIEQLEAKVVDLITKRDELTLIVGDLRTDAETFKAQKEQDLKVLTSKKNDLEDSIRTAQERFEFERADLARRKVAADEREAVLRRKEFRLVQDETTARRNADLMNL